MKNVVVIGGGHGLATILRGLKMLPDLNLVAIVSVSDSGGSTGRLRSLYNVPAMGDIRNVMCALANEESILSYLMDYRFSGNGNQDVLGHNLGNLIITAMIEREKGNFNDAIYSLSQILKIDGEIFPASLESIDLYARMEDGVIVKGEANIPKFNNHIDYVYYDHEVEASTWAIQAIERADYIILGVGSLFTSILPNIIIPKISSALNASSAKKLYYCNIMSESGETDSFSVEKHVDMLYKHGLKNIDGVVVANDVIDSEILDKYRLNGQERVTVTKSEHDYQIIYENLLDWSTGLLIHSPLKIAKSFDVILQKVNRN